MVTAMAKRKPKAEEPQPANEDGTKSIRVSVEMKRMVKWICAIEDITAQELMNWAALDRISHRFEPFRERVEEEERLERERESRLAAMRRLKPKE